MESRKAIRKMTLAIEHVEVEVTLSKSVLCARLYTPE